MAPPPVLPSSKTVYCLSSSDEEEDHNIIDIPKLIQKNKLPDPNSSSRPSSLSNFKSSLSSFDYYSSNSSSSNSEYSASIVISDDELSESDSDEINQIIKESNTIVNSQE